ncbi:hypothetical protein TSMEX_004433 [Taenia solium]|eukprot:TsM_000441400 transcript=TsM_000441400 gene=TsM_000441400
MRFNLDTVENLPLAWLFSLLRTLQIPTSTDFLDVAEPDREAG